MLSIAQNQSYNRLIDMITVACIVCIFIFLIWNIDCVSQFCVFSVLCVHY